MSFLLKKDLSAEHIKHFYESILYQEINKDWAYTDIAQAYYQEYFGAKFRNISFLFFEDGKYLAGIYAFSDSNILKYFNMPVRCFWMPGITRNQIQQFLCQLSPFLKDQGIDSLNIYEDPFIVAFFLSEISQFETFFEMYIDLTQSLDDIFHAFRKSYRPLVHKGLREYNIQIMNASNANELMFEQFHQFHIKIAGRETRSIFTWKLQYESICQGNSFVVYALKDNHLVSFVYILQPSTLSGTAYYGVSASDRNLMAEKTLCSHALLYKATVYAKESGATKFVLNFTPYNTQDHKLVQIDFFKKGFTETILPISVFSISLAQSRSLLKNRQSNIG